MKNLSDHAPTQWTTTLQKPRTIDFPIRLEKVVSWEFKHRVQGIVDVADLDSLTEPSALETYKSIVRKVARRVIEEKRVAKDSHPADRSQLFISVAMAYARSGGRL